MRYEPSIFFPRIARASREREARQWKKRGFYCRPRRYISGESSDDTFAQRETLFSIARVGLKFLFFFSWNNVVDCVERSSRTAIDIRSFYATYRVQLHR